MKEGAPSETAARMAIVRLTAARDRALRSLVSDPDEPYSVRFVRAHSGRARFQLFLWTSPLTHGIVTRLADKVATGMGLHILLRKRYLEDSARAALESGAEQLVVFAGGLDSLTLRLAKEFPEARFYELDHPNTQVVKRRVLEESGPRPVPVTLIPADFGSDSFEEKLRAAAGFRPDVRSVFIAEGLLMYLEQPVVEKIFACARRNGAPGSRFIFSALSREALENPDSIVARGARVTERLGEPIRSSIERKKLDALLKRHRFRRLELADHRTLKTTYLDPLHLDRPLMEGEFIVVAEAE